MIISHPGIFLLQLILCTFLIGPFVLNFTHVPHLIDILVAINGIVINQQGILQMINLYILL